MSLYFYKKAPVKKLRKRPSHPTITTSLDKIVYSIGRKLSSVKPISVIIPFIFIISGTAILYSQIKPYAIHFIQSKLSDKLNQEIIPLVPESYEEIRAKYISNPGSEYFSNLLSATDETSNVNFEGTFHLTIEKISIFDAPVLANVDSANEKVYQQALSRELAHFKGTKLPGEKGNILIYGHSAAGDYAEKNPDDVVTAFTRLFKLNIGDLIEIKLQDKEYNYIVKKIKEVNPEDIEILQPDGSSKTLTLLTCSPPGLSSSRLIVVAIQQ